MSWYGRGNNDGSWLPEEKKADMWHGRGNSGGSWPPAFPPLVKMPLMVQQKLILEIRTLFSPQLMMNQSLS